MHTIQLDAVTLDFLEDDMVHAHFKDGHVGTVEDVKEMFIAIHLERKGRKALLMVSVGNGSTLSNEARAYASSEESNSVIAADAIIVRDFSHQLTANVFIRHHRPHRPIKLFPDLESAKKWLGTQHHLVTLP